MVPLPLLKCLHAVKRVNFHWSDATCQSADRVVFLVGRAVSDKARSVLCAHCNEHYLFTLRAIADGSELKCPCCGNAICIGNSDYEPLLRDVRNTLHEIDCAALTLAFGRR